MSTPALSVGARVRAAGEPSDTICLSTSLSLSYTHNTLPLLTAFLSSSFLFPRPSPGALGETNGDGGVYYFPKVLGRIRNKSAVGGRDSLPVLPPPPPILSAKLSCLPVVYPLFGRRPSLEVGGRKVSIEE